MGNRRLGRKRLYAVEKKGQKVSLAPGPGISGSIIGAWQHREGYNITTEIAVDLGATQSTVKSGNDDRDVIGVVAGGAAYLTQLTEAKYGVITEVRAVVMEAPDSVADLDLEFGTDGDGVQDAQDGTSPTSIMASINVVGEDTSKAYDANELSDKYLYICQGAADTAENFSAGKLLIYLYGFVTPDDKTDAGTAAA